MQSASFVAVNTSVHDFAEHLAASAWYPQTCLDESNYWLQDIALSLLLAVNNRLSTTGTYGV